MEKPSYYFKENKEKSKETFMYIFRGLSIYNQDENKKYDIKVISTGITYKDMSFVNSDDGINDTACISFVRDENDYFGLAIFNSIRIPAKYIKHGDVEITVNQGEISRLLSPEEIMEEKVMSTTHVLFDVEKFTAGVYKIIGNDDKEQIVCFDDITPNSCHVSSILNNPEINVAYFTSSRWITPFMIEKLVKSIERLQDIPSVGIFPGDNEYDEDEEEYNDAED